MHNLHLRVRVGRGNQGTAMQAHLPFRVCRQLAEIREALPAVQE